MKPKALKLLFSDLYKSNYCYLQILFNSWCILSILLLPQKYSVFCIYHVMGHCGLWREEPQRCNLRIN